MATRQSDNHQFGRCLYSIKRKVGQDIVTRERPPSIYSLIEDRTPIGHGPRRIGVLSCEDDLPYVPAVLDRHKHAGFGFDVEGRTKRLSCIGVNLARRDVTRLTDSSLSSSQSTFG